jgi:Ser/Thr protein kinase RdoA (MazF antagonist)
VTGILDFGDCVHTCLIFELAICIAYIMLGKKDPLATAAHIYKVLVYEALSY